MSDRPFVWVAEGVATSVHVRNFSSVYYVVAMDEDHAKQVLANKIEQSCKFALKRIKFNSITKLSEIEIAVKLASS